MNFINIYNIFSRAKESYPNNIALKEKGRSVIYSELDDLIDLKSKELLDKGIGKNDAVLVFIPMSIELYVLLLSLFKIGATAVFVDQWSNVGRLNKCLSIVNCKGFVANLKGSLLLRLLSNEIRKIPIKLNGKVPRDQILSKPYTSKTKNEDIALITFTTGSTGTPKAAKRTHEFLNAQYQVLKKEINTKPSDIDLIGLPIVILCNLGVGATSVIPDYNLSKLEKLKPSKIIDQINDDKINRIIHSPFFFKKMSDFIGNESKSISSIENILTGGAPVFPDDVKVFKKSFNKAVINILYGSTESEPISHIKGEELVKNEEKILTHGLCIGDISDSINLKILPITKEPLAYKSNKEFNDIALKRGEIGEIVVNGAHVLKEYINNPEAIKQNKIKVEEEVWHRTGDAGMIINEQLFLVGRADFVFWKNDVLISPFIYEYLISSISEIKNGTVLLNNNIVIAFIQLKNSRDSKKVEEIILNKFPIVEKVKFVSKIDLDPRHNSKIDYKKLLSY